MLSSETSDSFLCYCLCVEKLTKNTIIKTYCLRICCQGTPKRAVHAEGGAVSINTKVNLRTHKSPAREIADITFRRRTMSPFPRNSFSSFYPSGYNYSNTVHLLCSIIDYWCLCLPVHRQFWGPLLLKSYVYYGVRIGKKGETTTNKCSL